MKWLTFFIIFLVDLFFSDNLLLSDIKLQYNNHNWWEEDTQNFPHGKPEGRMNQTDSNK